MLQVLLPDMELIVNLGDWPLNKKHRQPAFPVFSWCGSEDTRDIIWPTWDLMKATIMGMDRWVSVCCKEGGIHVALSPGSFQTTPTLFLGHSHFLVWLFVV